MEILVETIKSYSVTKVHLVKKLLHKIHTLNIYDPKLVYQNIFTFYPLCICTRGYTIFI